MTVDPRAPFLSTWMRGSVRLWQAYRGSVPLCAETDYDTAARFHRGMVEPWLPFDAKLGSYAPETVWDGDAGAFAPFASLPPSPAAGGAR